MATHVLQQVTQSLLAVWFKAMSGPEVAENKPLQDVSDLEEGIAGSFTATSLQLMLRFHRELRLKLFT